MQTLSLSTQEKEANLAEPRCKPPDGMQTLSFEATYFGHADTEEAATLLKTGTLPYDGHAPLLQAHTPRAPCGGSIISIALCLNATSRRA